MDKRDVVKFWLDGAQEDWEFAMEIYKSGKRLYNALFFGQLVLEKILKALHYHKRDDHPLLIHDLGVLAGRAGLNLNEDQKVDFKIITGFNVSARYDDYKSRVHKLATREYADVWMKKIGEARRYLLHYFT